MLERKLKWYNIKYFSPNINDVGKSINAWAFYTKYPRIYFAAQLFGD